MELRDVPYSNLFEEFIRQVSNSPELLIEIVMDFRKEYERRMRSKLELGQRK